VSGLLLLLAASPLFDSGARTQPTPQPDPGARTQPAPHAPTPAPAEIAVNGEILVTTGSLVSLSIPSAEVSDIVVSQEAVAQVRVSPTDANQVLIFGRSAGTASLTLKKKDKTEQVYTVIVEAPRLQVAKRLRSGFIAYSVDLPKENTVGSILGLNDYVVVFFTRSTDEEKKSIVLMKNIRVVAVPAGTVILEVTTEEAKLLKTSQESGTLALGLIADADLKDEKAIQDRKGKRVSPKK
jgi:hypothetical protein